MSTGPAAIVDPFILQHSALVDSDGWDADFPAANILDPRPKVKAKFEGGSFSSWFVIDTVAASPVPGPALHFDVFSILFVDDPVLDSSTLRVRSGASNGVWSNDTGSRVIWPFTGPPDGNITPFLDEFYTPPGIHMHIYLGASIWTSDTRFVRFDFGSLSPSGSFRIGAAACTKALIIPAEFGSSAGTPIEESEDLWTWGDERIVRPGPKYDRKSWNIFLSREQKQNAAYMTLKRRGSSSPLIAVDELPAPLPAANDDPWVRHQATLYGTITGVSPLVYAGPNLFRSRIDFQEL